MIVEMAIYRCNRVYLMFRDQKSENIARGFMLFADDGMLEKWNAVADRSAIYLAYRAYRINFCHEKYDQKAKRIAHPELYDYCTSKQE